MTFVTLVYFLYNYAKISQNPGKSALMIMVNVTVIIFFGKSEKNIWVFDFFEYNPKYRISKTVIAAQQIYSWNSIAVETADQI